MVCLIYNYLSQQQKIKFSWEKNNCLAFISGYLEYSGNEPLPKDWLEGYSNTAEAQVYYLEALKRYGCQDIVDALDMRFYRELTLHPQDGYIVARKTEDVMGYLVGLVCSDRCFFMSKQGLMFTEPEVTDIYWSITC